MSAIPGMLTLAEAAKVIGVSHSQVARYVKAGTIRAIDLGHQYLIREKDAASFSRIPRGNPAFQRRKVAGRKNTKKV